MLRSVASRFQSEYHLAWKGGVLCVALLLAAVFSTTTPASAAQTVPYKVNYQGRLTNSGGTALASGSYNMKFRLYSVASGGTASWTETRDISTQQVTVTSGGQFAVQLGDVTALSPSMFTSQPLYLEVELPTPATATCSTVGCASWTEGAMTPRQSLASSPYAMNADTVDGIDGANIATLSGQNTFTDVNTFMAYSEFVQTVDFDAGLSASGVVQLAGNNSGSKLWIQNNNAQDLFVADTYNMVVKVGVSTATTATLANVRLLSTSAEFNGTVRIGDATNGVDISGANGIVLSGTARRTKSILLVPEYAGAVLDAGSGSNNTGSMTSKFDLTNRRNYYKWTTTQATNQSYDVVLQVPIPSDFSAWASTTPITVDTYSSNYLSGTLTIFAYDTAGTIVTGMNGSTAITPTTSFAWQSRSAGTISGTYTPGGYMTLRLRLVSPTNGDTRLSNIKLDYLTKW